MRPKKTAEREYEEHNARDGCRVSMSFTSTGQYPARFNPVHEFQGSSHAVIMLAAI